MIKAKSERITKLEKEMEIVDWYIEVMEDNMNTKDILKDYIINKGLKEKVQ